MANATGAVAARGARATGHAGLTAATTVHVGLVAIEDAVAASIGGADSNDGVAKVAFAIVRNETTLAHGARVVTRPTTIYVGFIPVSHAVLATVRDTNRVDAQPRTTIGRFVADATGAALVQTTSAAVHVGLVPILHPIVAGVRYASPQRAAKARGAIAPIVAVLAQSAAAAFEAAAIGARLVPVEDAVAAKRSDTPEVSAVANPRGTVFRRQAPLVEVAQRFAATGSAAIEVGLARGWKTVATRGGASAIDGADDPVLTVGGRTAPRVDAASRLTRGAAAIDTGLVVVLYSIATVGRDANAVGRTKARGPIGPRPAAIITVGRCPRFFCIGDASDPSRPASQHVRQRLF